MTVRCHVAEEKSGEPVNLVYTTNNTSRHCMTWGIEDSHLAFAFDLHALHVAFGVCLPLENTKDLTHFVLSCSSAWTLWQNTTSWKIIRQTGSVSNLLIGPWFNCSDMRAGLHYKSFALQTEFVYYVCTGVCVFCCCWRSMFTLSWCPFDWFVTRFLTQVCSLFFFAGLRDASRWVLAPSAGALSS